MVTTETLYSCSTCNAFFSTKEEHRAHYKKEWHKYNLKRKVAGLPFITESEFNEKVKELIEQTNEKQIWNCEACKKVFNTENAFKNHVVSKKHIENVAKYKENKATMDADADDDISDLSENGNDKETKINWKKRFSEAKTEEEFNKILDEKIKMSRKLEESECLFCDFKGKNFDEKMEHMTNEHTFFVPDIEYLASLEGLIRYLGEKIAIGNTCIYCERMFHSLEAVRKHMLAKGHTKISYEDGPDLEISNFYDFSSLDDDDEVEVENENGGKEEGTSSSNIDHPQALTVTSEGTELILPSGAHIGHRDYKRYYNQNLREHDHSNSMALMPLSEKYKALGYYEIGSSGMTIEKERLEKMKTACGQLKIYSKRRQIMGEKINGFYIQWGRHGQFKKIILSRRY